MQRRHGTFCYFPRMGEGVGQKERTFLRHNFSAYFIDKTKKTTLKAELSEWFVELLARFELATSSLPRMRSTD